MSDWRLKLRDRDGLDLTVILAVLQSNQSVTRTLLDDKSRNDWDALAGIHDDTSDRIAEIEHVLEIESEQRPVIRRYAYEDMTEELPVRNLGVGRTAA